MVEPQNPIQSAQREAQGKIEAAKDKAGKIVGGFLGGLISKIPGFGGGDKITTPQPDINSAAGLQEVREDLALLGAHIPRYNDDGTPRTEAQQRQDILDVLSANPKYDMQTTAKKLHEAADKERSEANGFLKDGGKKIDGRIKDVEKDKAKGKTDAEHNAKLTEAEQFVDKVRADLKTLGVKLDDTGKTLAQKKDEMLVELHKLKGTSPKSDAEFVGDIALKAADKRDETEAIVTRQKIEQEKARVAAEERKRADAAKKPSAQDTAFFDNTKNFEDVKQDLISIGYKFDKVKPSEMYQAVIDKFNEFKKANKLDGKDNVTVHKELHRQAEDQRKKPKKRAALDGSGNGNLAYAMEGEELPDAGIVMADPAAQNLSLRDAFAGLPSNIVAGKGDQNAQVVPPVAPNAKGTDSKTPS